MAYLARVLLLLAGSSYLSGQAPMLDGQAVQRAIRKTFENTKPPGATITFAFKSIRIGTPLIGAPPEGSPDRMPTKVYPVSVDFTAHRVRVKDPETGPEELETCDWSGKVRLVFVYMEREWVYETGDDKLKQEHSCVTIDTAATIRRKAEAAARNPKPPAKK
jgi:hypothetical protein